jgi:hypothetical protein
MKTLGYPAMMMLGVMAACGGKRTEAGATADDPGLDLVFTAPAAAKKVTVPMIEIVPADGFATPDGKGAAALADGTELADVPEQGQLSIVRDVGGHKWVCEVHARGRGGQARGRATCAHLRVDGDRLIVPFAFPIMDGFVSVDGDHAELTIAGPPPAGARPMTIGAHAFACGAPKSGASVPAIVQSAAALCDALRAP